MKERSRDRNPTHQNGFILLTELSGFNLIKLTFEIMIRQYLYYNLIFTYVKIIKLSLVKKKKLKTKTKQIYLLLNILI
jgi:hypothetical protein